MDKSFMPWNQCPSFLIAFNGFYFLHAKTMTTMSTKLELLIFIYEIVINFK